MNTEKTQGVVALAAEIASKRKPQYSDLLQSVPFPTAQQKAAVATELKFSVPTDDKLKVKDLVDAWNAANVAIMRYAGNAARDDFRAQRAEIHAAALKGQDTTGPAWSLADYIEEYSERIKAHKAAQKKFAADAWAIVHPHCHRFADQVEKYAAKIEADETKLAERLSILYRPSFTVLSLYKLAQTARQISFGDGQHPNEIASLIGIKP